MFISRSQLFFKSICNITVYLTCIAFISTLSANYSESVEILQEKVSQWIQLEKDIEKNRASWKQEQILLQDEISILREDNQRLRDQIADSLDYLDQSDSDRTQLQNKRDRLKQLLKAMAPEVRKLELSCLRLYAFLPEALKLSLDGNYKKIRAVENMRIREDEIGERFMDVLNFFKEVEKFNSKVTVVQEIISVDGGKAREFNVIYIGLAVAYFVDDAREIAGYGVPKDGGWSFYERNGLLQEVSKFLEIYKNERPPAFVRLPVEVREILDR